MFFTLQNTINYARPFIEYAPLTAGNGMEPAISIGSMIRNSLCSPPQGWYFNRNEQSFPTVKGTQDYDTVITAGDFAYIEKVTLTDDQGNIYEIKDVYNNMPLAVSAFQQRPSAVAAQRMFFVGTAQHVVFRFLGVPDQIYTVTVSYQKRATQFGPFFITSVANAVGGNTVYTGTFDPLSLPTGATATITGFTAAVNNGVFTVVTSTATTLTVDNPSGTTATGTAYVANLSWNPIPNEYSDIYNNLFLAEALALEDDARAQLYRQRGVAAYLSKAAGLTEMQKNIFVQQWLQRGVERGYVGAASQQGNQGRGL